MKRVETYKTTVQRKLSVETRPVDLKAPGYSVRRIWHALRSVLRKLIDVSVFIPSVIGLVIGISMTFSSPLSSLAEIIHEWLRSTESFEELQASGSLDEWRNSESFIGRSIVVGSFVTGIFAWTGNVAAAKHKRDDLRVQIGMATDLGNSDLVDVEIREVFLRGRKLTGARLSRARMHNADFTGAELIDARMTAGSYVDSNFERAVMRDLGGYRANFFQCKFGGADLTRAILVKADLRSCDIRKTDLSHADLRGADLRDVWNLNFAIFDQTWYSSETTWPIGLDPTRVPGLVKKPSTESEDILDITESTGETVGLQEQPSEPQKVSKSTE